ncbi:hypothetical protein [Prosthecomicrobium hirschii]|uniref:hypothetical protein n=1 Tax=Prosthecodimorpha hirschii TaxID=665126 RepID=UPI00221E9912|nr:hypothetical protein [Prosthecomicrobium hirschii]MCW1843762.1 hypothetical protein [Prosthecomicrobium hirschii]
MSDAGELKARYSRRLLINVAGNFAARGVNLFSAVFTVPLAIAGLGAHDYGIFAMILLAATFVTCAGFGLAVVNPMTAADTRGDHDDARRVLSEAWSLLVIIAGAVFVIGTATVVALNGVASGDRTHLAAWVTFVACVAMALPAALTQLVLFVLQSNYEANLWMSADKIASLVGDCVAHRAGAGLWA